MKIYMVPILFVLIDTASGALNVALYKPTKLSSVSHGGISSRAVDGNTNAVWKQNSCVHSDAKKSNEWLCVDLEEIFDISSIKIFNRKDYEKRLNGFEIRLGSSGKCDSAGFTSATPCYKDKFPQPSGKLYHTIERCNVAAVASFTGRYVFVSVGESSPQPPVLNLCELQIFTENCPDGYYGTNCQLVCPQNCLNKECEKIGGGCSKGCLDSYYGEFCESKCNQNCKDQKCNWKTGKCAGCEVGFYCDSCNQPCANCKGSCRQSDGICFTGCKQGYWGMNGLCLQKCPDSCSSGCEINNGTCITD